MDKKRFFIRRLFNRLNHLNMRRIEECSTLTHWLDARPGECILDIGCGDGCYDSVIAKSGANVVGVDINETRLATAQRLYGGEQLTFLNKKAEDILFPDASFDKAVSFCVLEHLDDDELVIWKIAATLKPGGSMVFSADSLSNPEITTGERSRHQKLYAVHTYYTMENVQEKLNKAGLDILKMKYIFTTRLALALVRFSWKLDALPCRLGLIKILGYFGLLSIWALASLFPGLLSGKCDYGITLLVSSRKKG